MYRRLLKAVRAAVKFHKPAAANVRRALRDDFVAALIRSSVDSSSNVRLVGPGEFDYMSLML